MAPIARKLGVNGLIVSMVSPVSFLKNCGWLASDRLGKPVDRDGHPIPFMTYSAIEFIKSRIPKEARVFEYGSGYSTLWFARHTKEVCSVEHDNVWYDIVRTMLPDNARIIKAELEDKTGYASTIDRFEKEFDIIIIDGRHRVKCVETSLPKLSPTGVFIIDDWERPRYHVVADTLAEHGFHYIFFSGLKPCNTELSTTAIFYRPNSNVFAI